MKVIGIFLFLMYLLQSFQSNAQGKSGSVNWISNLSWAEIKEKAKKENKYIFLDCYATWCMPCKVMDKEVYTSDSVSSVLNSKFISVRVQMDKSEYDVEGVKSWYHTWETIKSNYSVRAYPTFLFFSPDGKPLHKDVGYKSVQKFVSLTNDALNPEKQYYSVLVNFKPGKIDTSELKGLARSFKILDKQLGGRIAADYLSRIKKNDRSTLDNVALMIEFKENKKIQEIATDFLRVRQKSFSAIEVKLINSFKDIAVVSQLAISYLRTLNTRELSKKENLELLRALRDHHQVKEIANIYIDNLAGDKIFTWDNIQLLADFTNSSKDKGYSIFYNQGEKIDSVFKMKDFGRNVLVTTNYSQAVVDNVIYNEEIFPLISLADSSNSDVEWDRLDSVISKKAGIDCADRIITNAKVNWYRHRTRKAEEKNIDATKWGEKFATSFASKIEKYGVDTSSGGFMAAVAGNDLECSIYRYCNDTAIINKAILWLQKIMVSQPGSDFGYVYAGLLYKAGYKKDAIAWQKVTIQAYEGACLEEKLDYKTTWYSKQMQILDKMQKGSPANEVIYLER